MFQGKKMDIAGLIIAFAHCFLKETSVKVCTVSCFNSDSLLLFKFFSWYSAHNVDKGTTKDSSKNIL